MERRHEVAEMDRGQALDDGGGEASLRIRG